MKNSNDTIEESNRNLPVVAQCLSQVLHRVTQSSVCVCLLIQEGGNIHSYCRDSRKSHYSHVIISFFLIILYLKKPSMNVKSVGDQNFGLSILL